MRQKDKYKRARQRVKAKKGFYGHLSSYISTGIFFFGLNMLTDPYEVWWYIPMLAWGVGLGIHYCSVFGLPGTDILSKEWEDREMEKELRKVGYESEQEIYEEDYLDGFEEDELDLRDIRLEQGRRGLDEGGEFV